LHSSTIFKQPALVLDHTRLVNLKSFKMFAKYFVAATAVLSLASAAATPIEEDWTLTLLKRQEPGTPAYACHEDCGKN